MAPRDVVDEFYRYVHNDVPLRMIFVPEMKLVDRFFMQEYYLPQIQEITEDAVEGGISQDADRDTAVARLVSGVVRYAILSHRWLPKDEPTFRDMIDGTVTARGREKLWNFCGIARTYGLMFAWSDTCCIDKSSSSELDEAIRSMFRWYRNATTCFVHLAQTSSLDDLQFDEWFERGWTLQELLAPRVTKFFSAEWQPLVDGPNDKTNQDLLQLISAATHCPEHALRRYTPGPFHVGRRMTWAARRKTTRGEDMAYALMGLFDVTLQTAYGEGAERAFCRLIEKIMLANGNTSVLNWAGKPASSHSSRAFPSSPRSYLGHPEYNFQRKLDISITSLGLRIPLLVLALRKPRSLGRTKDGNVRVELSFSDERISSVVDPITVALLRGEIIKNWDLAIGVFNYMPPYGNQVTGHPGIRPWSTGYLLSRRQAPDISQEDIQLGMKAKDDLKFHGWKKISTATFVCFTVKSVQRGEVMIMDKGFLEVVHL